MAKHQKILNKVIFNGNSLKIKDVFNVAVNGFMVESDIEMKEKVDNSRRIVDKLIAQNKTVYGITTGFGELSQISIPKEDTELLQRNLIMSHSVGVGKPFSEEVVRGAMLIRANSLIKGYSGVRWQIIQMLTEMLNKDIYPMIPEKGSLGASGDLAPLAHLCLVMLGEGEAKYQGKKMSGAQALRKAGLKPIILQAKEGLALINGTAVMSSLGALAVYEAERLLKLSDIAGALTFEALEGIRSAYDEHISQVRPYKGQRESAENLLSLTEGSELLAETHSSKVQDAYTLRCIPQVHGASRDAVRYVQGVLQLEINAATDNPLIFSEEKIISGGNFHGQPLALALDFLGIAIAELGDIAERRIERLLNSNYSNLPAFLVEHNGLNSGFMLTQYTAASLVSENKILSHPASVDSIPVSAGKEDHVSMATLAARKAREIIKNVQYIIAIELLCAAQAIDFQLPKKLGRGTKVVHKVIRESIPHLKKDRILYPDIEKSFNLIKNGKLIEKVEKVIGKLK